MDYCVITFVSTYGAITAQKTLREGGIPFLTMPVLREISAGCGISLRLAEDDLNRAAGLLSASPLGRNEFAFYGITGSGSQLSAVLLEK